jgi:prophage regulatory protein
MMSAVEISTTTLAANNGTTMKDTALEAAYAYAAQMQARHAPTRRFVRKSELRQIVPLADTTIYELERRNDFPRRILLTPRIPVWDLAEVEAWVDQRRKDTETGRIKPADAPRKRRRKPDAAQKKP